MLRVLVIDDEQAIQELLCKIMEQNFNQSVEIVGKGGSVAEAVKLIHKHRPDVVFIDIEMPGNSGLQLVDFFDPAELNFDIVFVTAYSEYAIKAFKVSAFDYLLKPIDIEDLADTLQRLLQRRTIKNTMVEQVNILKEQYQKELNLKKMAIRTLEGTHFVETDKIIYLEAEGTYTNIYMLENKKIVASRPVGDFEEMLSPHHLFFRTHRSYIINLQRIVKYSKTEGYSVFMQNGKEIPLSRYRKEDFEQRISP